MFDDASAFLSTSSSARLISFVFSCLNVGQTADNFCVKEVEKKDLRCGHRLWHRIPAKKISRNTTYIALQPKKQVISHCLLLRQPAWLDFPFGRCAMKCKEASMLMPHCVTRPYYEQQFERDALKGIIDQEHKMIRGEYKRVFVCQETSNSRGYCFLKSWWW
jgi:hypothetical protein